MPTIGGLAAVEAHWNRAFVSGDEAYLKTLLASDYISVGTNGVAHTRDMICTAAQNYALAHPHLDQAPSPDSHISVRLQ